MFTEKRRAIGVALAAILVIITSFLPWGQVYVGIGASSEITFTEQHILSGSVTITAWDSQISPSAIVLPNWHPAVIALPNWLVVPSAALAVILYWLRSKFPGRTPAILVFAPMAYGLLHSAFAAIVLITIEGNHADFGVFLTVFAFVIMLGILIGRHRERRSAILETP